MFNLHSPFWSSWGGGGGGGGEIRPWDIHWDQSGPTALSSEIAALLLPL